MKDCSVSQIGCCCAVVRTEPDFCDRLILIVMFRLCHTIHIFLKLM